MSTLSGSSLFSGINSGLTSAYSLISNAYSGEVSLSNIAAAKTNTSLTSSLNQTFASYIQTNFSSLDTDKSGTLSSSEIASLTTKITSQGLTSSQLTQLGTASGLSTSTLEKVLEHFNDIDANKDGKVTTAEISAYNVTCAAEKKKIEYANKAAGDMSVFYGSEDSSSDSSSLLAYKYDMDSDDSSS